jgi:hypothetical protein
MELLEECVSIPPVQTSGYEEKGKFEDVAGLKTCEFLLLLKNHYFSSSFGGELRQNTKKDQSFNSLTARGFLRNFLDVTGSPSAKRGLIAVYDIYGYASQTLQGADLLASTLEALVFVPDFFEGESMKDFAPQDTEEKKEGAAKFRATRLDLEKNKQTLLRLQGEYATKWPSVVGWGAYGFCWGGKVGLCLCFCCNREHERELGS